MSIAESSPDLIKKKNKGSLRIKLLLEAEKLLEKQGVKALTLRALAKACNVSHMAPYRHFANKQSLFGAIAANGFTRLEMAMSHSAADEIKERQLLAVGVAYIEFAIMHPALYRLMIGTSNINKSTFPELVEAREKSYQSCYDAVVETYSFLPNNIELAQKQALSLWALVHGYSSMMIDGAIDYPKNNPKALRVFIIDKLTIPTPEQK